MLDALIGAGANLLGNLFNKGNVEQNNATQMAIAQQNIALQKEFAQNGIQWKVADAQKAGLHPLAALGAQVSSFSPVSVGTEAHKNDFSGLGQDLSRAAKAMSGQAAREAVDAEKERKLDLESKALDNDIKRSTLGSRVLSTSRAGGQLGPPMPSPDMPPGASGFYSGSRSPTRSNQIALTGDDEKIKDAPGPGYKTFNLLGWNMKLDPNVPSGEAHENAFGESFGEKIAYLNTLPRHVLYDLSQRVPDHWMDFVSTENRPSLPTGRYKRRYRMHGEYP